MDQDVPPAPKPRSEGKNKPADGRGQQRSAKLRGNPVRDAPEVQLSKTLSWILRHGAKAEGVPMRADGYVRVKDLLASPKLHALDFLTLERLVLTDRKGRYNLLCEPDASPTASPTDIYWIRANQGHSIQDVTLDLEPITDASQVPMAVHGTTRRAWESIAKQGLSRMKRTHIHLAQGVPGSGVISGMRAASQILIHIDIARALAAGLPFFLSANGVVLTAGDTRGLIVPQFFARVEDAQGHEVAGWRRSDEANADVGTGTAARERAVGAGETRETGVQVVDTPSTVADEMAAKLNVAGGAAPPPTVPEQLESTITKDPPTI